MDETEQDGIDDSQPPHEESPTKEGNVQNTKTRRLQENNPGLFGVDNVQAREAWPYALGQGIKVCVVDSGLDASHVDFDQSRLDGFDNPGLQWFQDGDGHGTHVTGTIAAAHNGLGAQGVAPNVDVFVVRVFDSNGGFAFSSGLVGAARQCQQAGARVINMSLGGSAFSPAEEQLLGRIVQSGILIVAAAGNSGPNAGFSFPASYQNIISVAAVDSNNVVASFSQQNRRVDLSGPGVGVFSTLPGNQFGLLSGTSMASPHVAGVVALLWSFRPNASSGRIEQALLRSALDLGPSGRDNTYGFGIVQALAGLEDLKGGPLDDSDLLVNAPPENNAGGDNNNIRRREDPTLSTSQSSSVSCFSSSTLVHEQQQGPISIDKVQIGDRILTSKNTYETVYSLGHRHTSVAATFQQIFTSDSTDPLELTPEHMVYLVDGRAVPASSVKVGDRIQFLAITDINTTVDASVMVTKISSIIRRGVFAPFTASGTIVVNDGIVASTFLAFDTASSNLVIGGSALPISYQWLSWAFEAPHRLVCRHYWEYCQSETYEAATGISNWAYLPLIAAQFVLGQSMLVQYALSLPFVIVLSLAVAAEQLTSAEWLSTTVIVSLVLWWTFFYNQGMPRSTRKLKAS
uniref:subtilisin n=1 Tax=Cyclophora tenuis TaxID=216820 RepID=A0A7S1CV28_CYCTE